MRLCILCYLLLFSSLSLAGFHFEPYLGSTLSGDWKQGGSKNDASMTDFGFKMGYQASSGVQLGGELQMGVGKYKNMLSVNESKAGHAAFGLYLGYQSEMGLRGYAHYLFSSALVFDDLSKTNYAGNGYKLGLGYSLLSWLAINLEYHSMTYSKYKNSIITDFTSFSPSIKNDFVFLTLSFPFNFGGSESSTSRSKPFR